MSQEIIDDAKALCQKFINKVETGMARSKETYTECKALLKKIEAQEEVRDEEGSNAWGTCIRAGACDLDMYFCGENCSKYERI